MNAWIVGLGLAIGLGGFAHASEVPKFKDYPAQVYNGKKAQLRLDLPDVAAYRTRLREALREPVNFGGRYVFKEWGAGAQCSTGALLDVVTGEAHVLPFAACNWSGYDRPFEIRPTSRLMVVAGQVGEDGPRGAHFFEFTGTEFREVAVVPAEPAVADNAAVEPAAGPVATSDTTALVAAHWKENWKIANQNPFNLVFDCYNNTAAALKVKMENGLGEKFESYFVTAGGHAEMADLVIPMCDQQIREQRFFNDESAYTDANYAFRLLSSMMDMKMLANCKSQYCKDIAKAVFAEEKKGAASQSIDHDYGDVDYWTRERTGR